MSLQTKHVLLELLSKTENGMTDFKRWLDVELHRQIVTVVFTKKDGTERTMRCTLNPTAMPAIEAEKHENAEADYQLLEAVQAKAPRKQNPDVRTCYDVEGNAWKSFRWDSVKSVTYEDGIIGFTQL
jgi:hypothetical protein